MAISEIPVKDAELLAIEEINAAGGVLGKTIVPVVEDGGVTALATGVTALICGFRPTRIRSSASVPAVCARASVDDGPDGIGTAVPNSLKMLTKPMPKAAEQAFGLSNPRPRLFHRGQICRQGVIEQPGTG